MPPIIFHFLCYHCLRVHETWFCFDVFFFIGCLGFLVFGLPTPHCHSFRCRNCTTYSYGFLVLGVRFLSGKQHESVFILDLMIHLMDICYSMSSSRNECSPLQKKVWITLKSSTMHIFKYATELTSLRSSLLWAFLLNSNLEPTLFATESRPESVHMEENRGHDFFDFPGNPKKRHTCSVYLSQDIMEMMATDTCPIWTWKIDSETYSECSSDWSEPWDFLQRLTDESCRIYQWNMLFNSLEVSAAPGILY